MYDFVAAYFLFLPLYPLALINAYDMDAVTFVVWLAIGLGAFLILSKFGLLQLRKFFIATWLMPGTIVCGAAGIVPWPLSLIWYGSCANFLSITVTLIFNLVIVFGCSKLISNFKNKRNAA